MLVVFAKIGATVIRIFTNAYIAVATIMNATVAIRAVFTHG